MPSKIRPLHRVHARVLAAALAAASLVATVPAAAETGVTRLTVNWDQFFDAVKDGGVSLFSSERARNGESGPSAESSESKPLGLSPKVSLIARDWGGAQPLVGHMSVADQIRLSRSSRMVVSRLRLTEGRFSISSQIGLGQWRIDTDLMPIYPREIDTAAQLGGGFEIRLAKRVTLAMELDYTVLYRESHEPRKLTSTNFFGSFLAMRAAF